MPPEMAPAPADMAETGQESAPTPSQEGFEICLYVTPEGYRVEGPLPLEAEPQGSEVQDEGPQPDLTQALKEVLAIIKENPLGDDATAQMEAGYEASANG
jgi:hypothetical protein